MLEAMGAVQVRRNDHLVVEAIDGVVEVDVVEPELDARNRQDVAEVAECRADPRRKGSPEFFLAWIHCCCLVRVWVRVVEALQIGRRRARWREGDSRVPRGLGGGDTGPAGGSGQAGPQPVGGGGWLAVGRVLAPPWPGKACRNWLAMASPWADAADGGGPIGSAGRAAPAGGGGRSWRPAGRRHRARWWPSSPAGVRERAQDQPGGVGQEPPRREWRSPAPSLRSRMASSQTA
jgi:hypothetical protein